MAEERWELFYLCAQTVQRRSRVIVTRANAVSSDVKYKYCVDHLPPTPPIYRETRAAV